jgi:hypothetical protein
VTQSQAHAASATVPAIRARIYEQLGFPPYHEENPSPTGFQISIEVIPEEAIPRLPNDLSNLELKLTGRVLWGGELLSLIPVTESLIPPVSGLRHLLNKLIGALELWGPWAEEGVPPDAHTALAVRYHRAKVMLDFISALLLLKGEWLPGYQARLEQLRLLERQGPLLPRVGLLSRAAEQALAFKLNPSFPDCREAIDDWNRSTAELLTYVEALSSEVLGYEPGDPAHGYRPFLSYGRIGFLLPYAKQVLRRRRVPSLPGLAPLAVVAFSITENLRIGQVHAVHPLLRAYCSAWAWLSERHTGDEQRFMTRLVGSGLGRPTSDRVHLREKIISLFKRAATRKRLKRSL